MKGITTVFDNKKWVFAYIVLAILTWLIRTNKIDGEEFTMVLMALVPMVIGANAFDKSVWRKDVNNPL